MIQRYIISSFNFTNLTSWAIRQRAFQLEVNETPGEALKERRILQLRRSQSQAPPSARQNGKRTPKQRRAVTCR
eukprot:6201255-Pleurochrysis_carterae.AAC.2